MIKDQEYLKSKASYCLDLAKKLGATDASVTIGNSISETVNFRNKVLDESNRSDSLAMGIETYIGKNGLSLKLQGVESGFNTNARDRYVVLHGSDYATEEYIKKHGILGNSEGCPAMPMGEHKKIIELAKGGTVLFIYFPDPNYLEKSSYMMN